ncbi:MAG: sensor histidine kinase, partial [Thermodesulfobacteriota bacterium]
VNNIQQVFLNLIVNALDALADSRRKEINIDVLSDGELVRISVEDTGAGISPDILDKIFDPFFTTKPAGEGTGLGLSVCRNIIDDHGGQVTCESKVGVGTKFKILLPLEIGEERRAQNA